MLKRLVATLDLMVLGVVLGVAGGCVIGAFVWTMRILGAWS